MKKIFILVLLLSLNAWGQDFSIVAVGNAELEVDKIVISVPFGSESMGSSQKKLVTTFSDTIRSDFTFYKKKFEVVKDLSRSMKTSGGLNNNFWQEKGIQFVIRISVEAQGTLLNVKTQLFNINGNEQLSEVSNKLSIKGLRATAHSVANQLYKKITRKESIFNSKIFFVSDRSGSKRKPQKELYKMDFDGGNIIQLTFHKGTVISPAISPDRTKAIYSLIKSTKSKRRNINLYLLDLNTHKTKIISQKKGINSGAVFTPDGKDIVLTLSHTGNADLYKLNLKSGRTSKITKHYSADVDPSISADGRLMTFLSDRPGRAMIYTLNPSGVEKNVRRISYVGKYNATPRFSPDGKEIVFSSWLDNRFDIFRISSTGKALSRLTKDFGSNEDPTYSNDGQFIAFSSQRVFSQTRAVQNIYIMDRDGEIFGQITKNFGNCITPRWSK